MSLPPSSPRLPSPPPPAEIQIGPKSPLMGPNATRQAAQIEQTAIDTNAKRRIHPGTKSADMAAGPPLVPLHELDSAFQLQEHLAALHYYHTASHTTPVTRETAKLLATPPPGIDRTLWLYELCRFLIAQCNTLIVGFLFDTPPCSATTCPEMRAGEWQFLCAVHDTPKSCCAIDYCCHTLDWAANVVTNPKIFPSRFVVDPHDKHTASKSLTNVFRRLHRIFAHAWFQHRGVFWSVESQSGLYVFFKTVCDVYDLLPAENYKLPPEAEGLESSSTAADAADRTTDRKQSYHQQQFAPISIAKPPSQRDGEDGDYSSMSRTNTRRHIKSSPSVGSAVTTVPEADEDESADLSHRLGGMRISVPVNAGGETAELTSIPVIVDHRPVSVAEQPLRPSSVIPPPPRAAATTTNERQPEAAANESTSGAAEPVVSEAEFASEPEIPPPAEPEVNPASAPEPEAETAPESEATEPASTAPAEAKQESEGHQSAGPEAGAEEAETQHLEASPAATSTTSADAGGEHQHTAAAAAGEDDADAGATADAGGKAEEEAPAEPVAEDGEVPPSAAQPGSEPQAATSAGEGTEAETATASEVPAEEKKAETGEGEVASEEKAEAEQPEDKGGEEHKEEGKEAEQEK